MTSWCPATAVAARLQITLEPFGEPLALEADWDSLTAFCEHSFFNSWSWIGCWLDCLPRDIRPLVLRVEEEGQLVALGLLTPRKVRRHGVVRSRALFLHEAGEPSLNALRIEHNGFLLQRGREATIARAIVQFLDEDRAWDELFLGGVAADNAILTAAEATATSAKLVVESREPSLYVDLARLCDDGSDYLDRLSGNTRSQIRRSIREYEARGPLTITAAATTDEALAYLAELAKLHQQLWTSRGEPGAFSGEFFDRFHQTLVRRSFHTGGIQLLRVAAGETTVGYLYSFVADGYVSFYQSGFAYEENPKLKPGLVSHTLAIGLNRRLGHTTYDFLASDAQYKRSLATDSRDMLWAVLQRARLQFELERKLKSLKRQMAARASGEPTA